MRPSPRWLSSTPPCSASGSHLIQSGWSAPHLGGSFSPAAHHAQASTTLKAFLWCIRHSGWCNLFSKVNMLYSPMYLQKLSYERGRIQG
ncbi:hypothetical protein VPH35_007578 [Triticum aestivum]